MRIPLRAAIISLALLLTYGGFILACPETSRELGLDMWNYFDEEKELTANEAYGAQISRYGERVKQRLVMKAMIVHDVLDGRISLLEATQQFTYLNQADPRITKILQQMNPGIGEVEINARQVIGFVRCNSKQGFSDANAIVHRLESELARILHSCRNEVIW
jgi:hypothetical protein